ncbi:MAG: hypothetical protein HOH75_12585 [Chloroflexi bacterium]|nr:hypothetical protein [Chloroflexota bacterium]
MKKYWPAYVGLIIYLLFAIGLDQVVVLVRMSRTPDFDMQLFNLFYRLYWVLFAAGTLVYLWWMLKKLPGDKNFYIFQLTLGVLGIITNLSAYSRIIEIFPFSWIAKMYEYGGGVSQGLNMALTFVAGLGLIGLLSKNEE